MMFKFAAAVALMALSVVGARAQAVPAGYPEDYARMIEASKSERGLLIYSNFPASFWKPLTDAFNNVYPWIKVETGNFYAELWEKYRL